MKRSKAYSALLDRLAQEWRDAPIIERNYEYRDTFERMYECRTVELCHGEWCTFVQGSDMMPRKHATREEARATALRQLGL